MDKKSFFERVEDWWEDKATVFQKFCVIFALVVFALLLVVFCVIMPPIWAIKAHKAVFLLLWVLPIGAFTAIGFLNDSGDIDIW